MTDQVTGLQAEETKHLDPSVLLNIFFILFSPDLELHLEAHPISVMSFINLGVGGGLDGGAVGKQIQLSSFSSCHFLELDAGLLAPEHMMR